MLLVEKIDTWLKRGFVLIRTYYQHILSFVLIALAIFIVYGSDLEILVNEALQSEALSHILLVPFFAAVLFYLKRDLVAASVNLKKNRKETAAQYVDEVIGVALCLIAFLVYWYGSYTFNPLEYHLVSLPIFIAGVTLILLNLKALTVLIFPILFLLFLTPPPTDFTYAVGGGLANINTQASYSILKVFGLPVTLSSTYGPPTLTLTTAGGNPASFTVDVACSGIYSLIAFAMFAAFLAFIASASVVRKIGLFFLGFLIFEILNIARITIIVSIAFLLGEEIAMLVFHSIAGLVLIFIGMLLILFIAEKFFKIQILPKKQEQMPCPKCKKSLEGFKDFCLNCGRHLGAYREKLSQRFWLKLGMLIIGCSIVAYSIHAPTFAFAQGPVEVTSGWENATNVFPSKLEYADVNYSLRFLYRDMDFEKVARQDASLIYAYIPNNMSKSTIFVLVGVASSISNLHSWEVCLITWQTAQGKYPLVTTLDSRDVQLLPDVPIIARYLVFESPYNYTQITLYWYEKATFKTGITVEQKYVRISLIIMKPTGIDYRQYEEELHKVGQEIGDYWQPLKTQSLISLGIPAQQLLLAVSLVFIASTKTIQYSHEWRKKTNNLKIFNNTASPEEKVALQTFQEIAKEKKKIVTSDFAEALKRKTRKNIKFDDLTSLLVRLEEYGFIKRDVESVNNKPRLVWKTLVL